MAPTIVWHGIHSANASIAALARPSFTRNLYGARTTSSLFRNDTPLMETAHRRQALLPLTLGAIGVVYGDIGTSPLYTMSTIFGPGAGVPLDAWHLIGAASTIFWALMMVVTLKYVILILRADNNGEGGIDGADRARGARPPAARRSGAR